MSSHESDHFDPTNPNDIALALGIGSPIEVSSLGEALILFHSRQHNLRQQRRQELATNLAIDVKTNLVPRLKSRGGRPTIPEWEVSRRINLTPAVWTSLEETAVIASTEGRTVSPAQIASYLIQKAWQEY